MATLGEELKNAPLSRETEAAKEMLTGGHRPAHMNDALLVDGQTNERRPDGYDQFSVSEADRKRFGVTADEELRWIRDPNIWAGRAAGDPVRSFEAHNEGGRIIKTDDGYVKCAEDLILAAVPRNMAEAARKRSEEQARYELEGIREGSFTPQQRGDMDAIAARSEQTRNELQGAGMIGPGSPTHGMSYEAAAAIYGKKGDPQVDIMEAQYRRPGMPVVMTEEYQGRISDARAIAAGTVRPEAVATRRKVYAGTGSNVPRDANGRLFDSKGALQQAAAAVADGGTARTAR